MKKYILAVLIFGLALAFAVFAGNSSLSAADALNVMFGQGLQAQSLILFRIRLPRVCAAAFSGASLAVSGYLLQSNLNNVLASPGMLGVNNGAAVSVLISALIFPYQYGIKCIMAFAGALIVTALIYIISVSTGMAKTSVVLAGVAVSALCSAAVSTIISIWPETVSDRTAFMLGGFSAIALSAVRLAVPVCTAGIILSLILAPSLDILALGDETAQGLGMNIKLSRGLHIGCAALLSGAAVSMSGIISFVGLIVPNVVRLFYRGRSRGGILLCMLFGASMILICDTLSRIIVFPYELPCGLLLSIIGAPFLIWLLIRKRKKLAEH